MFRTKVIATVAVAAVMLGGSFAIAGSHADPAIAAAVKARQGIMRVYAQNLGVLGGMAKGAIPYDAAVASVAAGNLAHATKFNHMLMWPEGSDIDAFEGSNALPAMWANFADVGAKGGDLAAAADAMVAAAPNGAEAIGAAMGAVGGACGACHKAYRKPQQ
jgi:cytochrome c556